MIYGSVCSGIEAATAAWHPLGWRPAFFSEIEPFPCALLREKYPEVPNFGDMTNFREWPDAVVDVLVGGTPCQAFSVAGLRKGLADPRGNLTLTFLAIAERYRPCRVVWENVPGVLSDRTGAFGSLLGGLAELGYGWAYRVLDAQYFGLAQRRKRVFVVGSARGWADAAAVLFESESLRGDPAPRRAPRQRIAATLAGGFNPGGNAAGRRREDDVNIVCPTLRAGGNDTGGDRPPGMDADTCDSLQVVHALRGEGFDASEDGTGRGVPLVANPLTARMAKGINTTADEGQTAIVEQFTRPAAFAQNQRDEVRELGVAGAIGAVRRGDAKNETLLAFADLADPVAANQARTYTREGAHNFRVSNVALTASAVRRLTPRECERLQGFPDDYTAVMFRGKPAADGPRYKALGNSMAVPVMRWIGRRIQEVDALAVDAHI